MLKYNDLFCFCSPLGLHCQETGQLFVPFSKRPRNPQDGQDQEMKENDDDDEDSMSDLFPG